MFNEQEKLEITIDGLRSGDIFMNEDGIPVDECGDPIFEEKKKKKYIRKSGCHSM